MEVKVIAPEIDIKKISINNFKCFRSQEIDFGKLSVLAGANGVGKSSVIQSLLLIIRAFEESKTNSVISINDKKNTFLELGNTKEILHSDPSSENIFFQLWNIKNSHDISFSTTEYENSLVLQNDIGFSFHRNIIHYLNAERLGPRNILDMQDNVYTVGYQGEYTGQIIADAINKGVTVAPEKKFEDNSSPSIDRQIEYWTNFVLPDIEIQVKPYEEINKVRIGIRKKGTETDFLHPNNIGFGISYVLPIIVTGLIANKNNLVIIENPEAHLHPYSQSRIGQFLAKMAGTGVQILVETHSEHVINGIRIATLKEYIDHSDVIINFFSQKPGEQVNVHKIGLNKDADLKKWPFGFFDQIQQDFAEIMKLKNPKIL